MSTNIPKKGPKGARLRMLFGDAVSVRGDCSEEQKWDLRLHHESGSPTTVLLLFVRQIWEARRRRFCLRSCPFGFGGHQAGLPGAGEMIRLCLIDCTAGHRVCFLAHAALGRRPTTEATAVFSSLARPSQTLHHYCKRCSDLVKVQGMGLKIAVQLFFVVLSASDLPYETEKKITFACCEAVPVGTAGGFCWSAELYLSNKLIG